MGEKLDIPTNQVEHNEKEPEKLSIDYWMDLVLDGNIEHFEELATKIKETMKDEDPGMVSVILERACFLQCTHCLYQKDHKTSIKDSEAADLSSIVTNIVMQMPSEEESTRGMPPTFLHEGRMLRKWHFDVFERIRKERPEANINLIDAGNYTNFLEEFKDKKIKLDSIDISIDGNEKSHNLQRDPEKKKAFDIAVNGLRYAREVAKKVSSLLTLTNLNFSDIEETADFLFSSNPEESARSQETGEQLPFVDAFHISFMTPALAENFPIEISEEEMKDTWEQIKNVSSKYVEYEENEDGDTPYVSNVVVKVYRTKDLEKISHVVGEKKLWEAMNNNDEKDPNCITAEVGGIRFILDGVIVEYYPTSTWPTETIHIDADGGYRAPLCQQWGIEELRAGKAKNGSDISAYTFKQMTPESSYLESYQEVVDRYWDTFGRKNLVEEMKTFQRIREKAQEK